MKKTILFRAVLLLITLSATLPTMAEKISVSQAKTIANRFAGATLSNGSANGQNATTALSLAYKSQSEELYAFNVGQGAGFVLVAGDDLVQSRILGYCDEGSFNYDQLEGPAKDWIEQYAQTIAYAREHNIVVESSAALASEFDETITPLTTTKWRQNPIYNALCPTAGDNLTVTGCSATAMAQVMKYHNYPEHGKGSCGYSDSTKYNGVKYYYDVFADFEHTTYDWANMPTCVGVDSTEAQKNAVATLMYHCGVAAHATYGVNNTSTFEGIESTALIKYFGYDKGLQYEDLDFFTLEEWTDSLKADLKAGLPIFYYGYSPQNSGHAFVMDGYSSTGTFHINWGWGGLGNGYFSLLKMGLGTDDQHFNKFQSVCLHIKPDQGGVARCQLFEIFLESKIITVKLDTCGGMVPVSCSCFYNNADTLEVNAYMTLENILTGETLD